MYRRSRRARGEQNDLHGSAHFADAKEVAATGLLPSQMNAGGVVFGAWEDQRGKQHYRRHKGPEHIIAFAPTRSGKGVSIVIPTLLSWDQTVIVHDLKGEAWHYSAGWREKYLSQRCLKFAPHEPLSARYNPLDVIRKDHNLTKDAQVVATMISDPEGKVLRIQPLRSAVGDLGLA